MRSEEIRGPDDIPEKVEAGRVAADYIRELGETSSNEELEKAVVEVGRSNKLLGKNQTWNDELSAKGLQYWVDEIKMQKGIDTSPEEIQAALNSLSRAA